MIAVVSERTGYPPEMLDRELDLEADLSIDSIKRTEIFSALAERLQLSAPGTGLDEASLSALSARKTLQEIVAWIAARTGGASAPTPPVSTGTASTTPALRRWRVVPQPIDPPYAIEPPDRLRNHRIVLVADAGGISTALAALLRERGVCVDEIAPGDDVGTAIDGLIYLASADAHRPPVLPAAFATVQTALAAGASRILVATASGGRFGIGTELVAPDREMALRADAGWRGLIRTVAREHTEILARAVDLDPRLAPHEKAGLLLDELLDADGPAVVGWNGDTRYTLGIEPSELREEGGAARRRIPHLDEHSVALLTGGARGITAQVALALARETRCHIALIGRTPLSTRPEAADTADAADAVALRRALAARGMRVHAEIEAAVSRILAERKVRATIAQLEQFAASVTYHVADVREQRAVSGVIDDIARRHGRLDLVVHGAGTLEDRLIVDKSLASFERVWSTKVDGALALAASLPAATRYFVLFGSIAGAFGNRGQVDYAAANDALDTLAHTLNRRDVETRTLAIDWGPWSASGGGMVSPELEAEYARRAIGTIDPSDGVEALVRELTWGTRVDAQVVYACADAASLAGEAQAANGERAVAIGGLG